MKRHDEVWLTTGRVEYTGSGGVCQGVKAYGYTKSTKKNL